MIAPVQPKEPSFVNYAYEDHSGLETSQVSARMSPKALLAGSHRSAVNSDGVQDVYGAEKKRRGQLGKSLQDEAYGRNEHGLDTSLPSAIDPDTMF